MKASHPITLLASLAILAGCGGSQTVPQTTSPQNRVHQASGPRGEVLYVFTNHGTRMFSYPDLREAGSFNSNYDFRGGCSDDNASTIYLHDEASGPALREFPVGSKHLIRTITPPTGYDFRGCSVDPANGNVATVTEKIRTDRPAWIAVYPPGSSEPAKYRYQRYDLYVSCAYDDESNLFVLGVNTLYDGVLVELQNGDAKLQKVSLKSNLLRGPIQWDGQYLSSQISSGYPLEVYQLSISGLKGKLVSEAHYPHSRGPAWILGNTLVAPSESHRGLGFYNYPDGGRTTRRYHRNEFQFIYGAAIAPSH